MSNEKFESWLEENSSVIPDRTDEASVLSAEKYIEQMSLHSNSQAQVTTPTTKEQRRAIFDKIASCL